MKLYMNSQTRIIVATAVALTFVDLGVRALFLNRTPQTGDVLTAREIRLVDDRGNLRAHLYTDENSEPGLIMYDRNDTERLQLDTWEHIPSLILNRPDGARSTYYGMNDDGSALFHMYDDGGSTRVSLDAMGFNQFSTGNVRLTADSISVTSNGE